MRKSVVAMCAFLLCGLAFVPKTLADNTDANIFVTQDQVRVFIGSTEGMNASQAQKYNETQSDLLNRLASSASHSIGPALVTFNDFLTIEEIESVAQSIREINTVYIWMPGRDGRAIIDVANNDLNVTINDFFESLNIEDLHNSDYKNDMLALINNYGIFALEIKAEYSVLKSLSKLPGVRSVDVIQSEAAIAMASQVEKPISYICIPEKPDGTA